MVGGLPCGCYPFKYLIVFDAFVLAGPERGGIYKRTGAFPQTTGF